MRQSPCAKKHSNTIVIRKADLCRPATAVTIKFLPERIYNDRGSVYFVTRCQMKTDEKGLGYQTASQLYDCCNVSVGMAVPRAAQNEICSYPTLRRTWWYERIARRRQTVVSLKK